MTQGHDESAGDVIERAGKKRKQVGVGKGE